MDDTDITAQVDRAFRRYRFSHPLTDLSARRRRLGLLTPRPLVWTGAAVIALAIWAAAAGPVPGSPTLAFAGWGPVPQVPDANFIASAAERCHTADADPSMRLVVQDQRGNAAALVYAGGADLSICLVARDSVGAILTAASGFTHLGGLDAPLSVDTALFAPASSQSPGVRIVAGRASPAVASVKVARKDGVEVTAALSSGYFVAWWPSTAQGTTVTATDSGGAIVDVQAALN